MSSSSFSPSQAISTGWNLTTKNFWYVMQVVLLIFVVPQVILMFLGKGDVVELIVTVYSFFASMGAIKIMLSLVGGKKLPVADLFSQTSNFLNGALAAIISGAAVMLGLLLLVVPGLYIALRLQFALFFVVDKKMPGIDAVKASWKVTEGRVFDLFMLAILSILVMILGALALGIGVLVAYPVVALAQANTFRKLQGK